MINNYSKKYTINHNIFHERCATSETADYKSIAKKAQDSLGSTLEYAKINHRKL